MTDRVPSDHPSIETHRVPLARRGRLDRPRIDCSAAADSVPVGETVRLVLNGDTYHARVEAAFDDTPEIRGAYDNVRIAREPDAGADTDRLAEWRAAKDVEFGRSVLLDIVEPGFCYGLRVPGERAVYAAVEPPEDGLASIARRLEGRD